MSNEERTSYKSVEEKLEGCKKRRKELYDNTLTLTQERDELTAKIESHEKVFDEIKRQRDEYSANSNKLRGTLIQLGNKWPLIRAQTSKIVYESPSTSLQSIITKAKEEGDQHIATLRTALVRAHGEAGTDGGVSKLAIEAALDSTPIPCNLKTGEEK